MLDSGALGSTCAVIIGILGPVQALKLWDEAGVVRNWTALRAPIRRRACLPVAYFTFQFLTTILILYLWCKFQARLALLLLLEWSWLNGLSIQLFTFLDVIQIPISARVPLYIIIVLTGTLHATGVLLSFYNRHEGIALLCGGGFVVPLTLLVFSTHGSWINVASATSFKFGAGLVLLVSISVIGLNDFDSILQVHILLTSIASVGLVCLQAVRSVSEPLKLLESVKLSIAARQNSSEKAGLYNDVCEKSSALDATSVAATDEFVGSERRTCVLGLPLWSEVAFYNWEAPQASGSCTIPTEVNTFRLETSTIAVPPTPPPSPISFEHTEDPDQNDTDQTRAIERKDHLIVTLTTEISVIPDQSTSVLSISYEQFSNENGDIV